MLTPKLFVTILAIFSYSLIIAQNPSTEQQENLLSLEIDGLILNETKTKVGSDFYDLFYTKWSAPLEASDFIITIVELPSRGRGAQILINVNDQPVFRRALQPRSDLIEAAVELSIKVLRNHLIQRQKISSELGEGDVMGSGIF